MRGHIHPIVTMPVRAPSASSPAERDWAADRQEIQDRCPVQERQEGRSGPVPARRDRSQDQEMDRDQSRERCRGRVESLQSCSLGGQCILPGCFKIHLPAGRDEQAAKPPVASHASEARPLQCSFIRRQPARLEPGPQAEGDVQQVDNGVRQRGRRGELGDSPAGSRRKVPAHRCGQSPSTSSVVRQSRKKCVATKSNRASAVRFLIQISASAR